MRVTGSVSGSASGMLNIEGDGDKIDVTQVLTEGTKIATITINEGTEEEESIDLYAPEGFSGSWNDLTDKPTLFSGVYADLSGKPYLNGNVISGNMYSDIYSTDEQMIGTWIDGKPLYKRTIHIHNESAVTSDMTIGTIDSTFRVKNWKAFAIESGVNYKIPYVAGNGNASIYFPDNGNIQFTIRNTSFAAGSDFYITIEYTKTTDSIPT